MPRDATGAFTRPVAPYKAGTVIEALSVNAEMDEIAAALTGSIARDGSSSMLAPLPMGGNRIKGLGAPTAVDDAVPRSYADAVPLAKLGRFPKSMSGGPYGLNFSALPLLALTIPAGTKEFDLRVYLNWFNNHSALVAVLIAAGLRNAGDTADQQNATFARGVQVPGVFGNIAAEWNVTLDAALAEPRNIQIRAYTEASGQIAQAHDLRAVAACYKE